MIGIDGGEQPAGSRQSLPSLARQRLERSSATQSTRWAHVNAARSMRSAIPFLVAFAAVPAVAIDRFVPADFPTIQAALDAAQNGDRVVVAPGRYYESLRFPPRNIHLISSAGPAATTIDGQAIGTVVTFEGAPGRGAILEGFTLTNGIDSTGTKAGGVHIGQGASPVVRGNIIRQNWGFSNGHGISLWYPAAPLIVENEIRHNRSGPASGGGGGGGIGIAGSFCPVPPVCTVEVRDNYIGNNYATSFSNGGGIFLNGARAVITGNVIEFNTANDAGGGLSSVNGSPSRVENNLFHANVSGWYGGGIATSESLGSDGLIIVNNTFVANEASTGSAIESSGYNSQSRIANNLVSAVGSGSALLCRAQGNNPAPVVRHNIVYAPQGTAYAGGCTDMVGINGNLSVAPMFEGEEDFRLQPQSPGIDAGDASQSGESTDLAGRPRIADGNDDGVANIDVGAYELPPWRIFTNGFEPIP